MIDEKTKTEELRKKQQNRPEEKQQQNRAERQIDTEGGRERKNI